MKNSGKVINYLKFIKQEYSNLVAICPQTESVHGITRPTNNDDLVKFIEQYAPTHNLYYSVNEPLPNAPDTKLKKEHIGKINAVFLDADPKKNLPFDEERERLLNFAKTLNDSDYSPNIIIDSGGGIQSLWVLNEPLPIANADLIEDYGRGIADRFDTDRVFNIDRILRLPFTTNFPTAKKLKLGRKIVNTTVIFANENFTTFDAIKSHFNPVAKEIYNNDETDEIDITKLPISWKEHPKLHQKFKELLNYDSKLFALFSKDIDLPSRSEYDFTLAQCLKANSWTLQEVAIAMWLFPHGKGKELTSREISRAYQRATNPFQHYKLDDELLTTIESQPNIHKELSMVENKEIVDGDDSPKIEFEWAAKTDWKSSAVPLYKGLISQGSLVAVYGQSNIGKSFVTLDMAGHIVTGRDWGGYKLKSRGSVLVVAAEAGNTYNTRTSALKRRLGLDENLSIKDFPLAVYKNHIDLLGDKSSTEICPSIIKLAQQSKLLEIASGHECKMIIIDTLSAVFAGGNENSSDDMGKLVNNLLHLAKITNATILIVHHSGKDESAGLRGHSKLIAGIDTSLEVRQEKVGAFIKKELISRKQRDYDTSTNLEFNLNIVELGKDDDGDCVTSCNIILESDLSFESVIPDKLQQLTLDQYLIYMSIFVSTINNRHSKFNGKPAQNGFSRSYYNNFCNLNFKIAQDAFDYFDDLYIKNDKNLTRTCGQLAMSASYMTDGQNNTLSKRFLRGADKMPTNLNIAKDEQNQYFLVDTDNADITPTIKNVRAP